MERKRLSSHLLFWCAYLSLAWWPAGAVAIGAPLTVDSVQLGLPISSIDGKGSLDGSLFSGNFGEMTISVDSNNPTGYMSVWMQLNVSGAPVSYYEWEIIGWKGQHPYGELSYYDEVIVIDSALESYRVKTAGNTIRYNSTTNSLLSSNHIELIKVTVWTVGGDFTTAYFHLTLSPTQTSQLTDMFFSSGFAPNAPNSTLIVQVSDLHIDPGENYVPTPTIDDRLVDAINELEFLPDELVVSGDIAISRTPTIGQPRFLSHEILATEEMEAAVIEMQRFDSRMRQWIIPGNHDTDAQDDQPDLWSEIIGYPAFQRADISGVPVFFLNGKNSGDLDATQLAWLEPELATIADDQDIIVFVHQPSLVQISVERGIKRELVRMLAGRSGRVWVFSGHHHRFYDRNYIENGTQFIQTVISTGNPKAFNDGKNPGFGLIGLQDGRVVFRVSKDVKNPNYILLAPVLPGEGQAFIWPYEDVEFPALIRDEGTYSRDDYLFQGVFRDTGTWLVVGDISWRLPLSAYDENVNEVLILGGGGYSCEFSLDGTDGSWESAGTFFASVKNIFRIPIPEKFIGTDVFFRATKVKYSVFAGWGLSGLCPDSNDDGVCDFVDTDGDGVGNNADKDDDNDGLSDVFELSINTNPLLFDTDGDGISDYDEIDYGSNVGAYTLGADLNPLLVDTDSDGFNDYVEVNAGSNPLDNQSTPAYVYGDINGNDIVNVVDLLLAVQILLELKTPTPDELIRGDLAPLNNGVPVPNGEFNTGDLVVIQRKILGPFSF